MRSEVELLLGSAILLEDTEPEVAAEEDLVEDEDEDEEDNEEDPEEEDQDPILGN